MTVRLRKLLGAAVATTLVVATLAAPAGANVPQRETGTITCVLDAVGQASLTFTPTLTGVAAFEGFGTAVVTGVTGDEAETIPASSFFASTTFVKAVAGVAITIDVTGTPFSTNCGVGYGVDETPANDEQGAADVLTGASGSVVGSTRAATLTLPDEPQPFPDSNRVVWYRWTAPSTGTFRFESLPTIESGFLYPGTIWTALCLAIYGPANHFTPLMLGGHPVADGFAAYGGLFEVDVTAGTQYDIAVCSGGGTGEFTSAFGYTAPGAFTLTWEPVVTGPPPTITPGTASIAEGNSGTKTLNIPVTLSAASAQTVTAQFDTLQFNAGNEQEAKPAADYVAASGTVSFAPGQTSATVPITIKGDVLDEYDELFAVHFHNPTNGTVGGFYGLGIGTITDDDALPTIVPDFGALSVAEGSVDAVRSLHVSLSAPSGRTVTAHYATPFLGGNGVAEPDDYVAATGDVTFAPGATSATVPITVHGDAIPEEDELVGVLFGNPVNAKIGGVYGIGAIRLLNDD